MSYLFTIFTPCYNGSKFIHRVFESVASQTYTLFEWIIVNDGSTDNSDEVIQKLIAQYPEIAPKIIYLKQENLGKHAAWNRVLSIAQGEFFISADCDDSFLPNTLQFFNEKASSIENFTESRFSGINICCYNPENMKLIGTPYPQNGLISDNIELAYRYKIQGEHWGVVRTDLLKQTPFPNIKGKFYNEAYIWYSFAKEGYKVICYNEALRAYYYTPTSLVNNKSYKLDKKRILMEVSFGWWKISNISTVIFKHSPYEFLKLIISFLKDVCKLTLAFILQK